MARRCLRAGLALSLALASQAVLLPHSSATITLTVSTTADISPGDGACGDAGITTVPSPLSLREATCLANNLGGDTTISVPAGTYTLTEGELRLGDEPDQTTTVAGAGAGNTVIDAGGQSRVLEIDFNLTGGVSTTISGVTITGGSDDIYGGAGILAGSGNSDLPDGLTISDSAITGNQTDTGSASSQLPGGGLQFFGGSLTVSNTTISNNSSGTSPGSGVFYQSGGAGGGLTVTGSTFSGNAASASSTNGGALALGGGSYTVSATRFVGNTVSGGSARGAAIWSRDGALTVTGSTFTGNTVTGTGGAVAVDGGSAVLHYNRFTGNSAPTGSAVSRGGATVDATDNWWGCTTGPGTAGCDTVAGGPAVSPRLVLTATASPATVVGPNGTSTITASIAQNSLGSAIGSVNLGAFTGLPVSWTDPLPSGSLVGASSSTISSGSASTSYSSANTGGPGHVLATLDNGTATATVTVNRPPVVTTNPSDQTVGVGAPVTFTAAASGFPAPTVQWWATSGRVGGAVPGATSTSYTFTPTADDNGRRYWAVFSNAAGTVTTAFATLNVISAPRFGLPDHATFVVGNAGSYYFGTGGYPTPTLSRSGTQFPAWLTLTDNGNGAGTLTGTPPTGSAGTYQFTLTATNSVGSASKNFTLYVNDGAVIDSADHVTFVAGSAGVFWVTVAGVPIATTIVESGALPSGVSFQDDRNGYARLVGTPAAGTQGSYPITLTATAVFGPAVPSTQSFTLTVTGPPIFTSVDHATLVAGSAGSFTVTTSGGMGPVTITASGALPSGVTVTDNGNGTATLSGIPAAGTGGSYALTLTASDGITPNATQSSFTLTVNQPPAITSADHATFTVGVADSFTVTTSPGAPAATTITKTGSLPAGVTFTDNGEGTATLGGTPTAGGSFPITIKASNGVAPDSTQSFTLTVNSAPSITSADHTTFAVGSAGSFTVTTTPGNPSSTVITETGSLPSGVTFADNGDGTAALAGTPAAGTSGSYALTLKAQNSTGSNTQSFTLTVNEKAGITSADHTTFVVGTAGSFTVITTAGYPATTTITETGSLPSGVSFTDNGDGTATLAGTSAAGTAGSYPLTITATNAAGNRQQSFTLTVQPANASPVITSADHTTFAYGSAGSFTVTTTAGYPTATTITRTGALPAGVTFTDSGNGTATIAGTPTAAGSFTITITASNGATTDATQSFTLTVTKLPSITSADHASFVVGMSGSFTVTTVAGFPSATTITETGSLPSGVSFTDNGNGTATLAGTPAAGTAGSYPLTISATNAAGTSQQSFTLTVTEAPAITSADHTTFTVGSAGTFTVTTLPSAATITKTGSLPAGVSFTDNGNGTATIAGTPAAGTGGTYTLTISATNPSGTGTQSFTLTVNELAAFTSTNHATFTIGSSNTFPVTTAAGFPTATTLTETGSLPSGVSFTDNGNGTATLSGTPASGTTGSYPLTFSATNGTGTRQQSFTLTVQPPATAPAITSADHATFAKGSAGSFTVTTTGYPTVTLAKTGSLPAGVTFTDNGNGTATIAGTPTATGTFAITITASNGVNPNATQTFTLTVTAPPAITSANTVTFPANIAGSFTVSTSGFPVAAITETGSLPAGVTFTDNHNGTATIAGTPTATTDTNYPITIKASNGISPDATQSFTLKVTAVAAVALPAKAPKTAGKLGGVPSKIYVNQVITVTGSGYKPGAPIEIGWYSSASNGTKLTVLAHGFANAAGNFSIPVTVPNSTGSKTVMSAGMGSTGQPRYLGADTVVNPPLSASVSLLAGVPLTTTAGKTLTVSGAGYTAGTSIEIGWYLPQSVVGHAVADAAGKFRFSLTVPSQAGGRLVYAVGRGADGRTRYLLAATVVATPGRSGGSSTGGTSSGGTSTSTGGGLANTGLTDQRFSAASAGALALTGFALMMIGRRRRRDEEQ